MKRFITMILVVAALHSTYGQVDAASNFGEFQPREREMRTLTGDRSSHGGFGALMFSYTQIDGRGAAMAGFRAGWVINHSFAIGFGGHGFFNDLDDNLLDRTALTGGYGGLILEPIIFPRSPVHVSVPVLFGFGGIASFIEFPQFDTDPWGDYEYQDADVYFVIEPGINLELSVVKFMRVGLGASYRLTEDISLQGVNKNALNGFSGGLTLKFGKF